MPIEEVYELFHDNIDKDSTILWFRVKAADGRSAYFHVDYEQHPAFVSLHSMLIMPWGSGKFEKLHDEALKLLNQEPSVLPDFSDRPQIEETLPALREVFDQLQSSDSMMAFVDLEDHLWEDLNLTRQEFENQMDADIGKYGLSDVIVKGEDESLYTCYADLLTRFSLPLPNWVQEKERDDGKMSGREDDHKEHIFVDGLRIALQRYNQQGKQGKCGSWEIHDGGYDRWWELCYNGEPLVSCNASGEYLNGKEVGNMERERRISDGTFLEICKIIEREFPECRMSPEEAKKTGQEANDLEAAREPIKALVLTDTATLEKIKAQFNVEVQYTDKEAVLVDPFYHSNIMEEIDSQANSHLGESAYADAVLNDDNLKKELLDEICFRLDRAMAQDDDGINAVQAQEIIEQCFRHEQERYDSRNPVIAMDNFVKREQLKRLNSMSEINDMQEQGSVNLSKCVREFAKSFTPEQLEGFRRLLTPTGTKTKDTKKLLEMATRAAVHKLVVGEGVPPKEVVNTLIEYSPMTELADTRIPFNERTKTAMGIILEAQRFNEKVSGLEAGKEAEATL